MRFFAEFGAPNDIVGQGDIDSFDYLFLGNFVDRGTKSLEVICLLLALKLRYPDQIHIIRGAHEDIRLNKYHGLAEECELKLGDEPSEANSVFSMLNRLFEVLPIAAVIEDKVFASCGGIGPTIFTLSELETLRRPITLKDEPSMKIQKAVTEIVCQAPSENEDQVNRFLVQNGLSMVLRARECVADGIDELCRGTLVSVFSATNYGGRHANNAAMLTFRKTFKVNGELTSKCLAPMTNSSLDLWLDDRRRNDLERRPATPPRRRI
eukprot:TRINITY_DN10814_c0_g4_i4.p1 TRINITY_DN10814_c0_g4~~TRINITY_DN10814_c0_g4_i4.p1  ORF type:complete len:266 (-),score=39.38 TRINITY_DN10814_c0_g4_i4:123-920(-)